MTNYVNFLTDKIRPAVVQAYLDGPGTPEDFMGSDSSTMDYTKFGYTLCILRRMIQDGSASTEVKDIVKTLSAFENSDGLKNYEQKSASGYSIADMIVYEARGDTDFSINALAEGVADGFMDYFNSIAIKQASSVVASPIHMMIEFMHATALSELSEEAFIPSDTDNSMDMMSPLAYALKRAADNGMTGDRLAIYNIVKDKYPIDDYAAALGANSSSTNESNTKNDLTRLIVSASHDTLESGIDELVSLVPGDKIPTSLLLDSVTKAEGLSKNSIVFDLGIYKGGITGEQNTGYSPLFYYINRYKTSCRISILDKLVTKFSMFAISIENDTTEGYTPMELLTNAFNLTDDGEWNNPDLVAWAKAQLSEIDTTSDYKFFAAAGNVRDFTGGKSTNAYGVVTNIFRTINRYHRKLKNDSEDPDFSYDPTPLISAVFPPVVTSSLYEEWMTLFGQEI